MVLIINSVWHVAYALPHFHIRVTCWILSRTFPPEVQNLKSILTGESTASLISLLYYWHLVPLYETFVDEYWVSFFSDFSLGSKYNDILNSPYDLNKSLTLLLPELLLLLLLLLPPPPLPPPQIIIIIIINYIHPLLWKQIRNYKITKQTKSKDRTRRRYSDFHITETMSASKKLTGLEDSTKIN